MTDIEALLHEYGYPNEMIPNMLKNLDAMSYDDVEKRIMPYQDITADRHSTAKGIPFNEYGL